MKGTIVILIILIIAAILYGERTYLKAKRMGWMNKEISSANDSALVILIAGQSTAANSGNERFSAENEVYNFWNGKLYTASDPLMGSDGNGGSPWCLLADMIIDSGLAKQVLLIPIAQSETSAKDWASGRCMKILTATLQQVKKSGLTVDYFFWQQGENDVGRSADYGKQLGQVIDTMRNYCKAPVFVSLTSYNHIIEGNDTSLRNVQQGLIDSVPYVLRGPDTDSIGHRYDKQHFSGEGLKKLAHAWFKQIKLCDEVSYCR